MFNIGDMVELKYMKIRRNNMRLIIDILKSILFGAMILIPTIILCLFALCSEYGLVLFIFSFIIGDICRMK